MPPNENADFLKEFDPKPEADPFEQPLAPETEKVEEEKEEEVGVKYDRHLRRVEAKLQAERETAIALAARLEALTEAQKFSREQNPEIDETITRIYGTNTPEAAEATALLTKALQNVESRARDSALEAFREEQAKERDAVAKEEKSLDAMVEEIEDEYGVTLDKQTQQAFFQQLEKLSPKDADGNIIAYADHNSVWEDLQSRKAPANTRAKDIASRGMARTGASPNTSVETDANERWLREAGII